MISAMAAPGYRNFAWVMVLAMLRKVRWLYASSTAARKTSSGSASAWGSSAMSPKKMSAKVDTRSLRIFARMASSISKLIGGVVLVGVVFDGAEKHVAIVKLCDVDEWGCC